MKYIKLPFDINFGCQMSEYKINTFLPFIMTKKAKVPVKNGSLRVSNIMECISHCLDLKDFSYYMNYIYLLIWFGPTNSQVIKSVSTKTPF